MPRLHTTQRNAWRCCGAKVRVASPVASTSGGSASSNSTAELPTLLVARPADKSPVARNPEKTDFAGALEAVENESLTQGVTASGSSLDAASASADSRGLTADAVELSGSSDGDTTPGNPAWTKPNQLLQVFQRKNNRNSSEHRRGQTFNLEDATKKSEELFADAPESVPSIGGCVDLRLPHSEHLLPAEVVLFEPSVEEIFSGGITTGGNRQIFLNTPLTAQEQRALRALHLGLEKQGYPSGKFPNFMRLHALRMLQQCKYDAAKTIALMHTHLTERVARLPVAEADVLEDLRSGWIYWHGRDRRCRPCLVIRPERIGEMIRDRERAIRSVIYVLEYAVRYAMVPGRVENWVVILDFTNVMSLISPFHLPSMASTAVAIAVALEKVYCGRMVWMKIVNMPGNGMLRNVVNGAIPADKKKKIAFPTDLASAMAEHFEPNQLEQRYGGTAPDLEPGQTHPFRFFPGCTGLATQEQAPELTGVEHSSLHAVSGRAFHEGCVWDDSLPETRADWLRKACYTSMTTEAAQAASDVLKERGEPAVAPCRDVQHWLELAGMAELRAPSTRRFDGAARRAPSRPPAFRRWW